MKVIVKYTINGTDDWEVFDDIIDALELLNDNDVTFATVYDATEVKMDKGWRLAE